MAPKIIKQGSHLTIRDDDNNIVNRTTVEPGKLTKKSWRAALRELTNDGQDLHVAMFNMAQGAPIVHRLPDGRVSEPVCPPPEVMLRAQQILLEMMHGKAVAQSEVSKAIDDEVEREALRAMSEADLWKLLEEKRKSFANLPVPKEEDDGA